MLITCRIDEPKLSRIPDSPSVRMVYPDSVFTHFETVFEQNLKASGCPGAAVAIVKGSEIVYMKGFGVRKNHTTDSVNTQTVFRIGSLSKGFTGVLTGKLIQEGCLSWDDKVVDIIPDFDLKDHEQAQRISVQHLLSQSTGLQRHAYTDLTEHGWDIMDIVPMFSNLDVYGPEGELYAYQNAAFSMIEELIARRTGSTFQELLYKDIFQPAGMPTASATYEEIIENDNVALPHAPVRSKGYVPISISNKYYNAISAGGINASIHDMAIWLQVLLGNRPDIISDETLDFIFSPLVKTRSRYYYDRWPGVVNSYYGIGWRVLEQADKMLIYHGGFVNDYASQIAIDRENKVAICVLFNAPNSFTSKVIPTFFNECELLEALSGFPSVPVF